MQQNRSVARRYAPAEEVNNVESKKGRKKERHYPKPHKSAKWVEKEDAWLFDGQLHYKGSQKRSCEEE